MQVHCARITIYFLFSGNNANGRATWGSPVFLFIFHVLPILRLLRKSQRLLSYSIVFFSYAFACSLLRRSMLPEWVEFFTKKYGLSPRFVFWFVSIIIMRMVYTYISLSNHSPVLFLSLVSFSLLQQILRGFVSLNQYANESEGVSKVAQYSSVSEPVTLKFTFQFLLFF